MFNNNQPKQPHQLVNNPSGFLNQNNQFFPRTQSTPPEEPKKTSSSGKLRLKASTSFIPTGNSTIVSSFLTGSATTSANPSLVKADISQNTTVDTSNEVNLSSNTLNSSVESTQKAAPIKRKRLTTSSQNFAIALAKLVEISVPAQDIVPEQIQEEQEDKQEETKIESESNTVPASKAIVEEQKFQDSVNIDLQIVDEQEPETLPEEANQKAEEDIIAPEDPEEFSESQPTENIVKMDRSSLEETIKKLANLLGSNGLSDTLIFLKERKIFSHEIQRSVKAVKPVKPTNPEETERPHQPWFLRAPVIPVKMNPNTWLLGKQAEEKKDSDEVIKKKIKLNLNILTPDNFEKVREYILNIAASSLDNCKRVAESIVENAWKQKHYASTYARLCTYLGTAESLYFEQTDSSTKKRNDFKVHIIKQIQLIFESNPMEDITIKENFEKMDEEQKALYLDKKKEKILGNMRFIGELFLEKFIVVGVVYIVTASLVQKFLQEYSEYKSNKGASPKPNEDSLEGLIKFYETIGAAVEEKENLNSKAKAGNAFIKSLQELLVQINNNEFSLEDLQKLKSDKICLNDLFKILDVILKEASISTRMNSLIINLVEMKNNGWKAPLSKGQGPKTMKQIQEEFEREHSEKQQNRQDYRDESNKQKYHAHQSSTNTKATIRIALPIHQAVPTKPEQPKFDPNTMKIDTQISFKPNRSKGATQQNNPEMSIESIQKELKDIYKLINGDQAENKQSPNDELKKLAAKASGKRMLEVYFETFCDGRLDVVKKRLFIPDFMLGEKRITSQEFLEKFSEGIEKMYEMACDYPELENNFALIFLDYCTRCEKNAPLSKIPFSQGFFERDESELILEFYQDFLKAILRNLDENYKHLKDELEEDDLKEFAKKIGIEDYDAFRSSI